MERLTINTIGPLPADTEGYQYVIVIINTMTRVVELYATRDNSAKAAATALLEHVTRYAAAAELLSDNELQYVNNLIQNLQN